MPLESPVQRDGDMGFIGYASRLNPIMLPAGLLQLSENMRLDRGVATTRKGAKRMASNIAPSNSPLTVPFNLAAVTGTGDPIVRSVYSGGIFGSAVVRSPDAIDSFECVVLAAADQAYIAIFDSGNEFSERWGSGPLLATNSPDPDEEIVTDTGEELLSTLLPSGLTYPVGETIEPTDRVSLVQAFNRLYLLREADINKNGWETKSVTSGGISVSGTVATVNLATHGFSADMRVRIEGSTVAAFNGHEFDILGGVNAPTTDTFKITVPSGTASDSTTTGRTVRRVKAPLFWDLDPSTNFVRSPAGVPSVGPTYKAMPSVAWAVYANNRLIIPSDRDGVLISDWQEPNVYDPFWQSFRANKGSNDYLVAVQPWVENAFLVFMRKSVWLATLSQFPSTDGSAMAIDSVVSNLELLTDEVGCVARKSIAVAGQYVFFLSDSGVYRLDSRLDLKLRGDTKPLSDPIADQFQSLDPAAAAKSVGLWFDNRYWLSVPQSDSAASRAWLFCYSALNEQWETRDTYGFGIDDILVVTNEQERRMVTTSQAGTVMLLDEIEEGDESPDPLITGYAGPVAGKIVTRRYGFGSMQSKRFLRSLADVVLPNTASVRVTALTYNPDRTKRLQDLAPESYQILTNSSGDEEDYTIKQPIRNKAHYCELEFLTTAHRPEIRNVSIEAALASLPQTETRTAE
jgi:hypothetical protein